MAKVAQTRRMPGSYGFGRPCSKKSPRGRAAAASAANLCRRMRLVFSSDLHIEHHPEVAELVAAQARRLGAEVLIIAGDLGGRPPLAQDALAALAQGAPTV